MSDQYMLSYDGVSLFTNIPLSEHIDSAIDVSMQNYPDIDVDRRDL